MVEIGGEREFLRENVTDQERERECLRERGFGGAALKCRVGVLFDRGSRKRLKVSRFPCVRCNRNKRRKVLLLAKQ